MLRDAWRVVLDTHEGLMEVFEHGDVDCASRVIPVDVHAKGPLAVSIM